VPKTPWEELEIDFAISKYFDLQQRIQENSKFKRSTVIAEHCAAFPHRSEPSVRYLFHNISHLLSEIGEPWIPGLKPQPHVSDLVRQRFQHAMDQNFIAFDPVELRLKSRVITHSISPNIPPNGSIKPRTVDSTRKTFARSVRVAAYVEKAANGVCELCDQRAPFIDVSGLPFLEVHHIRMLADEGPDTVDNAVAVCPNCHRALHFSANSADLKESLFFKIERLRRY